MPAIAASSSLSDVSPETPTQPTTAPAASLTSTPPGTGTSLPPIAAAAAVMKYACCSARAIRDRDPMPSASAPYALPNAISNRLLDEPSSRSTLTTWPPASSTTTVSGFRPWSLPAARTPAVMDLAVSRPMLTRHSSESSPNLPGMLTIMLPSQITATDYHTGGEPFRIVADPPVPIPGRTVAERRALAIEDPAVQGLRAVLCSEPRGHADMYGGFIVPADDQGADLGVLFWHKDGFSTACGHGTIALGGWAAETGLVRAPETGTVDVVIDVPSGRVTARVHRHAGRVAAVDFVNVPSHVVATGIPVQTAYGVVPVDVAFGGALYAHLDVARVGLHVEPAA